MSHFLPASTLHQLKDRKTSKEGTGSLETYQNILHWKIKLFAKYCKSFVNLLYQINYSNISPPLLLFGGISTFSFWGERSWAYHASSPLKTYHASAENRLIRGNWWIVYELTHRSWKLAPKWQQRMPINALNNQSSHFSLSQISSISPTNVNQS